MVTTLPKGQNFVGKDPKTFYQNDCRSEEFVIGQQTEGTGIVVVRGQKEAGRFNRRLRDVTGLISSCL